MKDSATKKNPKKGLSDITAPPVVLMLAFYSLNILLLPKQKDLFVPLIPWFVYTERRFGASVPLSGRNPIPVTCKKITVLCSFSTQPMSRALFFDEVLCHFWCFSSHVVWRKWSRGGEKEIRDGLDRGMALD